MRKFWIRSLALSLGLAVTGARGQEAVWQAPKRPAATLCKPVAIAASKPAEAPSPAVSLGRPVAIASTPKPDAAVQQVVFTAGRDPNKPVVRGSAPESIPAQPMPMGPTATGMPAAGMHTWNRGDGVVATTVSRNDSAAPPPPRSSSETILVPPTPVQPSGPAMSAPAAPLPGPISGPGITMTPGVVPSPGVTLTPNAGPFPAPAIIQGGPNVIANGGSPCCDAPACGPACGPAGCGGPSAAAAGAWGCGGCCDGPGLIVGGEFLLWWMKGDSTPPLVTIGRGGAVDGNDFANILATQGRVTAGGERMGDNVRPGARVFGTYWFDDRCWGIDGSAFYLGNADNASYSSGFFNGNILSIGRPFVVPAPGSPLGFEQVAGPNLAGKVTVTRQSNLWGADGNLRRNVWCCGNLRADLLFGGRVLGLDENLAIEEFLIVTNPPAGTQLRAGQQFNVTDRFVTQNRFYGGQVGVDAEYRYGAFSLGMKGKIGLGLTEQSLQVNGSTTLDGVEQPNAKGQSGGLLAQSGSGLNGGSYSKKMFGIVPEVGVTLGYDICDWWRVTAGYNFLYWNSVVRPGEQVNTSVNPTLLNRAGAAPAFAGPNQPAPLFRSSDLYVHGVTFGMEFRY